MGKKDEAEEAKTTLVQVGILSGGEVISTSQQSGDQADGNFGFVRGYVEDPSEGFRDEATAALVPAYTKWLKKHLVTDECLERAGLEVEDLFVDASVLAGDWD